MSKILAVTMAVAGLGAMGAAHARDQVRVVGSSTVFPYSQAVAESFASKSGGASPVVESTGTGGGMKIFCQGIGEGHPDVTGASRAMKKSEYDVCVTNGVTDITEALIGYDGLTIAISRKSPADWDLNEEQIFRALAAEVPAKKSDGTIVWAANPNKKWSDIDSSLPDTAILAYGPPPTSGTRDAFVELAMHDGCKAIVGDAGYDKDKCSRMRQDGPFVEAGENDNLIVQRLEADPNAMGIFGYSFLYENEDKLKAVAVDGVTPDADTIASFEYGIARPIYVYFKNAHRGVIPGLNEFIEEYISEDSLAQGGYNNERGLTPLPTDRLKQVQADVKAGKKFAAQ
ncbi:substrate-binding domain-containing protein [Orrella marina]|uniref:substrate-binding domain-containing protein n=1 Tax=Orrella marina TaxID=2163011 RepID=UPI001D1317A3|nr:substrate-binding domain-containing protein [Orrella marina]